MRTKRVRILLSILILSVAFAAAGDAQTGRVSSAFTIARVKYSGGGDWYNDPSGEVNLLNFVRQETGIAVDARYVPVSIMSEDFFSYPFIFLTGHGNITLTDAEARRLRIYLENGGFLFADDDYGMDASFRREMKRVFPDRPLVELPFDYGLYHAQFDFSNGPPKTHEHDNKPPRGYGIFHEGRLVVYYTVESNPSDGWADAAIHNDPEPKRQEALRFGTNIVVWALTQ